MATRRGFMSHAVFLAASTVVGAQPRSRVARLGLLTGGAVPMDSEPVAALREDLRKLGWIEGDNLVVEFRFAGSDTARLPALVAELLRARVDVIVVGSTPGAIAAKAATSTVPIVFAMVSDPVASGIVADLARPGGNVTGTSNMLPETSTKLLEILREVVPKLARVAVLYSPDNPGKLLEVTVLQEQADRSGVRVSRHPIRTADDVARAFVAMPRQNTDGVAVLHDQATAPLKKEIVDSAVRLKLPSIYQVSDFADAGGLMSYGVNVAAQYRRTAVYVDKILRGAKPRDLPVELPLTFDFVVNLRTARLLGLAIPPAVVARADRIIA